METVFEAIARTHSRLARERVLGDIKALTRDTQDLVRATVSDLRAGVSHARSQVEWSRLLQTHPYPFLGTALGLGVLVGILIRRK